MLQEHHSAVQTSCKQRIRKRCSPHKSELGPHPLALLTRLCLWRTWRTLCWDSMWIFDCFRRLYTLLRKLDFSLIFRYIFPRMCLVSHPSAVSPNVDMPPELILLILDEFKTSISDEDTRETKRLLSSFALVCRDWRLAYQPLLFKHITLRSQEDLQQFARLLQYPGSIIQLCVEYLTLEESLSDQAPTSPSLPEHVHDPSWSHVLPIRLYKRLQNLKALKHSYVGLASALPTPPFLQMPSSLHATTLLSSGFRTVNQLTLENHRFSTFSDFVRILGGFASLKELHCTRVSWATGSLPLSHRRTHLALSNLRVITTMQCADTWLFLWLFSTPQVADVAVRDGNLRVHPDEVQTIADIASLVFRGIHPEPDVVTCFEFTPCKSISKSIVHILLTLET